MNNYLLLLILLAICLGGVPLEEQDKNKWVKPALYILLAVLGLLAIFGGGTLTFR